MKGPPRLAVPLRSSRCAVALVIVSHASTIALLWWVSALPGLRVGAMAVVIINGVIALRGFIGSARMVLLQLGLDRRIRFTTRDGVQREGQVLGGSYVGPRLTTIVWMPDGARWARTL